MANKWTKPEHAEAYLARMEDIPHRVEGEATLLSEVPTEAKRVLDLEEPSVRRFRVEYRRSK